MKKNASVNLALGFGIDDEIHPIDVIVKAIKAKNLGLIEYISGNSYMCIVGGRRWDPLQ